MKKFFGIFLLSAAIVPASAQRVLSLDSCRQMALRNIANRPALSTCPT